MHFIVARLKRVFTTREGLLFLAMLIAAIIIRLPLMTFRGYYDDLASYVTWGTIVNQHFTNIYTANSGSGVGPGRGGFGIFVGSTINYPPGTPYLFGALVYLFHHWPANSYHTTLATLMNSDGEGPFIAKIPLLVSDVAATVLLYWQARRRHTAEFALIAATSFAFSPALLYNGVIWGQTDGLVALPILAGLFALLDERYILGGVSLALAVLIKPQPIIFVPLVLLYVWRWHGRQNFIRFAVAGAVTLLIFCLPILVPHFQILDMLHNVQTQSYNASSRLTSDAFNFWWLIGYSQETISSTFLGISSGIVGDLLFGAVTVVCGYQIWRRREPIVFLFALAVQIFSFFMFMGGQHERYLFLYVPLMLACLIVSDHVGEKHLVALYMLGTALCFLNMLVGVGGGLYASRQVLPFLNVTVLSDIISTGFTSWAFLIALAAFATFVYAVNVFVSDKSMPVPKSDGQLEGAALHDWSAAAAGEARSTDQLQLDKKNSFG